MVRRSMVRALSLGLVLGLCFVPATAAIAAEADTTASTTAWFWEDQERQTVQDPTSGTDAATVELPNPFCPSTPGLGSVPGAPCEPGRLPIEVRGGDYETPNKLSAVGFDLAVVPPGSKVQKMTATFLEANDQQSAPVNAEGRQLKACLVKQFFGEGEARLYTELPKFECKGAPVAKRKEVKAKGQDGDTRYQYSFDLTKYAKKWVASGTLVSGVVLFPVEPKNPEPARDSNWRVVLVGTQDEDEDGLKGEIVYTPAETSLGGLGGLGGLDGELDGEGSFGGFGSGSTGGVSSSGFGSTSGGSLGTGTTTTTDVAAGDTAAEDPAATAEDPTALAAEETGSEIPGVQAFPAYMWLAIIAGLIAFSMFRSYVLERSVGVRPDGVLAQIRRLNAERRGAPIAEAGGASASPVMEGLKKLGGGAAGAFSSLKNKLPFSRKG